MKLITSKIDYHHPKTQSNNPDKKFYNSKDWQTLRTSVMTSDIGRYCAVYYYLGQYRDSQMVDHIIRISALGSMRDRSNLMALSNIAHQIKRNLESRGIFDNLIEGLDYYTDGKWLYPTDHLKLVIVDKIAEQLEPKLWEQIKYRRG